MTIQGQVVERLAAEVLMTIDGQTMHTLCLFGEPGELGDSGCCHPGAIRARRGSRPTPVGVSDPVWRL